MNKENRYSVLSNLAYILSGIFFIVTGDIWQIYLGSLLLLLGFSSGMFHLLDRYFWQKADEISMLALFGSLIVFQATQSISHLPIAILFSALLGILHKKWNSDTIGLLAITTVILMSTRVGFGQSAAALLLFLGSVLFNEVSSIKISVLRPDVKHAIWHVGTDIAITLTILNQLF